MCSMSFHTAAGMTNAFLPEFDGNLKEYDARSSDNPRAQSDAGLGWIHMEGTFKKCSRIRPITSYMRFRRCFKVLLAGPECRVVGVVSPSYRSAIWVVFGPVRIRDAAHVVTRRETYLATPDGDVDQIVGNVIVPGAVTTVRSDRSS